MNEVKLISVTALRSIIDGMEGCAARLGSIGDLIDKRKAVAVDAG